MTLLEAVLISHKIRLVFLLTLSVTAGTMDIYKENSPMAFILGIESEQKATNIYECEKLPNLKLEVFNQRTK